MPPAKPTFSGLFQPSLFKPILFKAKATAKFGDKPPDTTVKPQGMSAETIFAEQAIEAETVPTPKIFLDLVKRQWASPTSGPMSTSNDRTFFNVDKDMAQVLLPPSIDAPVTALHTSANMPGAPEDALKPEDKKADPTLQRGHQAEAWAVRAAMTTSFFNRSCLLWLQDLQQWVPIADVRAHQDINKLLAAIQFSSDATLLAARFASRVIASSVASRRLLWLCQWQADVRNKWCLASAPFTGGSLFGAALDPFLVENKDKQKVLPTAP